MVGLIWFVQVVQYPSFLYIDATDFQQFHGSHVHRTGFVVIPVMLLELGSSIWLSVVDSPLLLLNRVGLGIVLALWLSTLLVQAPIHQKLQMNFSKSLLNKLIRTNWLRTILWSSKALLSFYGCCYFLYKWGN
jgi:hypothetical protein